MYLLILICLLCSGFFVLFLIYRAKVISTWPGKCSCLTFCFGVALFPLYAKLGNTIAICATLLLFVWGFGFAALQQGALTEAPHDEGRLDKD